MNAHFSSADLPRTTQAAEGLPRRRFTVAEIEAAVQAGIFRDDERFELLDGEVVPMNAKGARHEHIKTSLLDFWMERWPRRFRIAQETALKLDVSSFLEPDFLFYPKTMTLPDITAQKLLLAVEVADTSLRYDTGLKATYYSRFGLKTLWIINAVTLDTHVFSAPSADGYLERRHIAASEMLVPDFAPELAVKLAELPLI